LPLELKPELVPPMFSPRLNHRDLPEKEQEAGYSFTLNLDAMLRHAKEFSECVALFNVSQQQSQGSDLWRAWMFIAPKAAIVALYNYRMAMDGAMNARRSCRTWEKLLDNAALEAARMRFRDAFPHTRELRQTVLHDAERFGKDERRQINQISKGHEDEIMSIDPGSTVIADANIYNSKYSCLFGGTMYYLDITAENAIKLVGITREFLAPFETLSEKLEQQKQSK
jgi:hypothetical protein